MQISDITLPDLPLGVESIYSSDSSPRSAPLIAVAFSSCIYIYRNLKLFYKYYLPSMELNTSEMEIWKQVRNYCLFLYFLFLFCLIIIRLVTILNIFFCSFFIRFPLHDIK